MLASMLVVHSRASGDWGADVPVGGCLAQLVEAQVEVCTQ